MDIRRKAVRDVLLRVNEVILGKERLTLEVLAALLAGGHVLLEVMEERQVTVEGETRSLPELFFVIAT